MLSIAKLKGKGTELIEYNESDMSALIGNDSYSEEAIPHTQLIGSGWTGLDVRSYSRNLITNALDGLDPMNGKKVVKSHPKRVAGYDLTFSAPKSVSAIWALSCDVTINNTSLRQALDMAHHKAVERAIAHMEQHVIYTRQGKAGLDLRRCRTGLFCAAYPHGASRAGDPNLYTHVVAANIAQRPDGTYGALDAMPMLRHKMAAGSVYRSEYAAILKQIGFTIERDGDSFMIKGVPPMLIDEWSKRRRQIEEALAKHHFYGSKAAEYAALNTRSDKPEFTPEELQYRWLEDAEKHGFSIRNIQEMLLDSLTTQSEDEPPQMPKHEDMIALLTKRYRFFDEHNIYFTVAQQAQGITDADGIERYVTEMMNSPDLAKITNSKGAVKYSSRECYISDRYARILIESIIARLSSENDSDTDSPSIH